MGQLGKTFSLSIALLLLSLLFSSVLSMPDAINEQISKKISRLTSKATKSQGVIELDSLSFEDALAKPRNYSMVVLFTAISPEFQCVPCKNFDPEYRLVAAGWSGIPDKSKIFFGILDYKAGQSIFQKFDMSSAPSVLYFPVVESWSLIPSYDRYDLSTSGFQAESFAKWVNARSGLHIQVQRPFDFMAFLLKTIGLTGILGLSRFLYSRGGMVIQSRYLWATISLFLIFIFISGHMWNHIRHPPYSMVGRDGRFVFIAPSYQSQFGLETQIVAIFYAALCGGTISLISSIPTIENPSRQRIAVFIWMTAITVIYSVLLLIFRVKSPSYPYRLLF